MSPIYLFLSTAVTALAVENPVFARALGLERETMFMKSARAGILLGVALTWMTTASSLFVVVVNHLLLVLGAGQITLIRPLLYLLGVVIVHILTVRVILQMIGFFAPYKSRLEEALPVATFNTALFGAFYISVSQNFGFLQTIGYALGTGVGYTIAILIIYFARKRLALCPVPRSFRGLPILLVYLGLMSLALYGIIGRALPT